jgi:hypothetical protein
MKNQFMSGLFVVFALALLPVTAGTMHPRISSLAYKDTTVNIWVVFKDKPDNMIQSRLFSQAALARRLRVGFQDRQRQDIPVNGRYVARIEAEGAKLRQIFKWANAASFSVTPQIAIKLAELSFVKSVSLVGMYTPVKSASWANSVGKRAKAPSAYGESLEQLSLIGVPQAHQYFEKLGLKPGNGVIVGVFDEGFWLGHPCFSHVVENDAVLAARDFVLNSSDPYISYVEHGTQTMSLIGGYDSASFIGTAWNANFVIARTEEGSEEHHQEEDNWAAAVVWAESLGVDIVTSSLGYRDGFTSPDTDYTFEDLDGKTTIIARAAQWAVERGVIVVNAMGNESFHSEEGYDSCTISSPADVEGVISVGGVASDLSISPFSSAGPASDGRIKPDLCAMASSVLVPVTAGYSTSSGTSFATPMVAGVTALICQRFPSNSAEQIRERLYRSCSFVPGQKAHDNVFGRGVPDALLACLDTNEFYGICVNEDGSRSAGAEIYCGDSAAAVSDAYGAFVVVIEPSFLPETLTVRKAGRDVAEYIVTELMCRAGIMSCENNQLVLSVRDTVGDPVPDAEVLAWYSGQGDTALYTTDASGKAAIKRNGMSQLFVKARTAEHSDFPVTSIEYLSCIDSAIMILDPRILPVIEVSAKVMSMVNIRNGNGIVYMDLRALKGRMDVNDRMTVSIRSANGRTVWEYEEHSGLSRAVDSDGLGMLTWDCRNINGRSVSPGVYLVAVRYGTRSYSAKILVSR